MLPLCVLGAREFAGSWLIIRSEVQLAARQFSRLEAQLVERPRTEFLFLSLFSFLFIGGSIDDQTLKCLGAKFGRVQESEERGMSAMPDWGTGLGEERNGTTDAAQNDNPLFEAPMQLCRPSPCHTFLEAVPETIKALKAIKSCVAVIAGVGSQRIGKSTVLNLLHSRKTSGFGLGHTLDAQTAGIWIWMREHPKDSGLVVCFADTEGLDTPHIQQSYNWMLSALTLLISTVFLYQSKSSIDSSATERLSTILAVAEQMIGQDGAELALKPSFLWVLRDMQLQMAKDPKTEMMEKLETSHIRKMKKSFHDFDCFPLPRPVDTEEALQEVETMEFENLKANFQEEFFLLDRLVFRLAAARAEESGGAGGGAGRQAMTGEVLGEMVTRYIGAIRAREGLLASISELPSQAQLIAQVLGTVSEAHSGSLAFANRMGAQMGLGFRV